MTETTVHAIDKTGWPEGPWLHEPDRLQWTTKAGLPGLILRHDLGHLCGYAAVAPGHPLYEVSYDNVELPQGVHGGLTYSDPCQGAICHVPEPGQPDNVWWFGFDCAHCFDLSPGIRPLMRSAIGGPLPSDLAPQPEFMRDVYRDLTYVQSEVESLAAQLVALG